MSAIITKTAIVKRKNNTYLSTSPVFLRNTSVKKTNLNRLIKKENVEEHLDYGDKFITNNKFEWESQTETIIGNNRYNRLTSFDKADVFVRKTQREDGVNLPYIYLGKGKLTEPRATQNKGKTVLFDVILDNKLPDNLFEQFNFEDKTN